MARTPKSPGKNPASKAAKVPRSEKKAARKARWAQIKQTFTFARERDSKLLPYIGLAILGPLLVLTGVGIALKSYIVFPILGLVLGLVVAVNVFARRVQKSAYAEVEGKPGAAAGVVDTLRGNWALTPMVQFNRNQDFVHRVVGRPGVILLAEGGVAKRSLLAAEARRVRKVVGSTPVYEIVIGSGDGEVEIAKLAKHMVKLPRNLKAAEATAVNKRLKALGGGNAPLPKGPVPTRVPRGRGF